MSKLSTSSRTEENRSVHFLKIHRKTSSTRVNTLEIYPIRITHHEQRIIQEEEMRIFQHSPLSHIEVSSGQICENSSFAFVRVRG